MKFFYYGLVALLAFYLRGVAQVLLCQENFPDPSPSGNLPVSAWGWSNAIPNNPNRLYQLAGTNGAVFAYQADADVPISTAFFTTTSLDNGATGMAFRSFNPALFTGLTLSADIQPYYLPDSIAARFAVQMNGANWFVAATALPVPTTVGGFVTCTQAFNPAAMFWNSLTIRSTNAVIGAVATSNLLGNITGAGLVFTHTAHGGTHNFDNFLITATMGSLSVGSVSNGVLKFSWPGANSILLQSNTNLASGSWLDEANTAGQSAATISLTNRQKFFRLKLQAGAGVSLNLANLSFEMDGTNTATPQGWTSTGSSISSLVNSNDAFTGHFSLLHSNSSAYQVQTSLLITNLANGYYQLGAWTKNSGGQKACYLAGNDKLTSLPPLDTNWTPMIVRGISVTNGQCLISLYSSASASNWCRVDALTLTKDNLAYNFLKGGDISELTYVEQGGGKFYETNGVAMDCLQILKNHGFNIVRLRLYNDPSPANSMLPLGIQSPTNILNLAARAKAMGFQIELTFYYSDGWANTIPRAWTNYNFSQLNAAVYSFTTNFMTQMKNQGTSPEFVSLGNEMQGGILLPLGSSTNFTNLKPLLNNGYAAVKLVSPDTKVILHVAPVDAPSVNWFFDQCVSNGVNWDVTGCSYYPFWTGLTTEQARTNLNLISQRYNKPVLVMETGYNWASNRCDGYTGQLANNGPEFFPSTPLGQKNFLLKCFNDLKLVNNGNCLGDLYWDPIFICVPGLGWQLGQPNVVDNTTLFNFNGNALPSLDAFDFNN